MSSKERTVDIGSARARSIIVDLGAEIRRSRQDHGLSQAVVARAAKTSRSQVGRIEHGQSCGVSVIELARLLAVVGLELSARAYPAGSPIRDEAHLILIDRLRRRSSRSIAWRLEVPVGGPGDMRAWDAVMHIGGAKLAVEVETRPRDLQALQRRMALKLRDTPGMSGMVLLLGDTRYNRHLVRQQGESLRTELPIDGAAVLEALSSGRDPGGSGVVLI
jgi:transcriptional regulator with XRE-family HTH domain